MACQARRSAGSQSVCLIPRLLRTPVLRSSPTSSSCRKRHQLLEGPLPIWVNTEIIDPEVHCYDDHDAETDGKIRQNRIYGQHPEWIIGKTATRRGMYTRGEYTVKYDGDTSIGDLVAEILEDILPEDGMVDS